MTPAEKKMKVIEDALLKNVFGGENTCQEDVCRYGCVKETCEINPVCPFDEEEN